MSDTKALKTRRFRFIGYEYQTWWQDMLDTMRFDEGDTRRKLETMTWDDLYDNMVDAGYYDHNTQGLFEVTYELVASTDVFTTPQGRRGRTFVIQAVCYINVRPSDYGPGVRERALRDVHRRVRKSKKVKNRWWTLLMHYAGPSALEQRRDRRLGMFEFHWDWQPQEYVDGQWKTVDACDLRESWLGSPEND